MADQHKLWSGRDRVARGLSADGNIRIQVVRASVTTSTAQERHRLMQLPSLMLARALCSATLLAAQLKGEERIMLRFEGNGTVRLVYAEAMQVGEVRGFVRDNTQPFERSKSPLGFGTLSVSKILYNKFEPVTGVVQLSDGDVTSDVVNYMNQSEQIPSAGAIDVSYRKNQYIDHAGGVFVQVMPGTQRSELFRIYDRINELPRITDMFLDGYSLEEVMHEVFGAEPCAVESTPVDFFCRCSLERFRDMLTTLGMKEVESMAKSGQNELVCKYCNAHYYLSDEDFALIQTSILTRLN